MLIWMAKNTVQADDWQDGSTAFEIANAFITHTGSCMDVWTLVENMRQLGIVKRPDGRTDRKLKNYFV